MRYLFLVLALCLFHALVGDDKVPSRIEEILPLPFHSLNVEPEIPSEFIAMSPEGSMGVIDWTYWGPKEVLEEYFADNSKLKSGIIRVKMSANVAQSGPSSFMKEEQLIDMDPNADVVRTYWGEYPVLALKLNFMERKMYTAWVGLNDPATGFTLMFNMVYPEDRDEANEEDLALWENFILNTKGIPSVN